MSQNKSNQSVLDGAEKSNKMRFKMLSIDINNEIIGDLEMNIFSEWGGNQNAVR